MSVLGDYVTYDSKESVRPEELQELYRFTHWGKSRTLEQIERMLQGTSMCFSMRYEGRLVAFCRFITDFVFRGTLWDILVHPDHQGKGVGSALLDYVLGHPVVSPIPLIITYSSDLSSFLIRKGFERREGAVVLIKRPIEYT
ncbi:acetyltransferase, N-acetylglutamate synthase [Thermanaerovibrio velox DSM 12556]|uniref:Acetyltransferase, N-acetylglutamate synthase n=1 Tax=Thermanaerovibrio velox DSM 12556 TaxID=926567 RepID=H0USH3_9BACT|nr:GNAT family N-acetyltransferase [Thermanaerovibrio velox]EHM10262.1 acetyltransferase, N-acetylglutamate synthase [Thermanaerovibrio velox DSM 12556]